MSLTLSKKTNALVVSYDCGDGRLQTLLVPKSVYHSDFAFRAFVKHMKCLDCGLETDFGGRGN